MPAPRDVVLACDSIADHNTTKGLGESSEYRTSRILLDAATSRFAYAYRIVTCTIHSVDVRFFRRQQCGGFDIVD